MYCGLSENFTLCDMTHKALFFKVLCAKMPQRTSKLSDNFPSSFTPIIFCFFKELYQLLAVRMPEVSGFFTAYPCDGRHIHA
jgi:hypothetical protein